MAKGKHAPNKGALKQAEKVKKVHFLLSSFHDIETNEKGFTPWK